MQKNEEPIYLSKEGYEEFLQSIEEIKERIKENDLGRNAAFDAGAGDGWDSPEFEEIERTSIRLNNELNAKYEEKKRIVILEKHNEEDTVDIGDILSVDMNGEELIFKLVGGEGDIFAELQEISINSPIGMAVYKKKIGDVCEYNVDSRKFIVTINKKLNEEKESTDEKPKVKEKE